MQLLNVLENNSEFNFLTRMTSFFLPYHKMINDLQADHK